MSDLQNNSKLTIHNLCIGAEIQRKYPVKEMVLNESGVLGDTNYGRSNRQLCMTGKDVIDRIAENFGLKILYNGSLNENIIVENMLGLTVKPLDRLVANDTELEVTHIGDASYKDLQSATDVFLSRYAIYLRVVKPGVLMPGDIFTYIPKKFKIAVVVLSDRASKGEYKDLSGKKIESVLSGWFDKLHYQYQIDYSVIPDNPEQLSGLMKQYLFDNFDLVVTSGGTGIGPRDFTVETIRPLLTKEIPGIMEMIRYKSAMVKPSAMLSGGVAGIMGKTLVFTLPGSVSAVDDYLTEILKVLEHAFMTIYNIDNH